MNFLRINAYFKRISTVFARFTLSGLYTQSVRVLFIFVLVHMNCYALCLTIVACIFFLV